MRLPAAGGKEYLIIASSLGRPENRSVAARS